jgi:tetratricopeptide (TPR) repeat protein
MAAILTEDPPPLASPLQSVIARALARPVSHRFASAAALREALTRVGRGPQEDPPPPRRDLPKAAVDPAAEKLSARARAVEQAPSRRDATGDYDAAIANMERAVALGGRTAIFIGALGHCLAASGRHDDARALLRELEGRSRDRYVSPFNVMLVHLGLGDLHQAFVHFEDALAEHNAQLRMAPVEPRFDPLRGDARFRELTARFGLRSEA